MAKIVIIGGGASGMAAAISAGENPENQVYLLERQNRVGKKLMATGNGRCNLCNTHVSIANYHGNMPEFVAPALEKYPPEQVLSFFHGLGLMTVEEYGGRVFPKSGHGSSVLDVLRLALEKPNIRVLTDAPVYDVHKENRGFTVFYEGGQLEADYLIVACGGCAGSKLGGVMDGYQLLKGLGHSRSALYPALTQIRTAPEYPKSMKGIKVDGVIRIQKGKTVLGEARGDILFNDSGVSGTAVFTISGIAAAEGDDLMLVIDLFPEQKANDLYLYLKARAQQYPELPAEKLLTGAVQNRVGQTLCRYAKVNGTAPAASLRDRDMRNLSKAAKEFRLPVTGVSGFEVAQVTSGGIKTGGFDPCTMESKIVPGLFACGEVLDVDGDCGGYNLLWAWASGLIAGKLGKD